MQKPTTLSFKDLKQRVSIEQVLRHFDLFEGLTLKGKSHRGPCPLCEASDGTPFSVSLEKNCYQCFSCTASGNILDLVAQWEGISIREAGKFLQQHFVKAKEPQTPPTSAEKITETQPPPAKHEAPPPPEVPAQSVEAEEKAANTTSTHAPAVPSQDKTRNEPLTFTLKNIEPNHPNVKALGIHEDTITAFGVGYYTGKGMMEHRIVIPIHNHSRQLVAYAGFHPEDRTHTYPPKFRRDLELYNVRGAIAEAGADAGLIVVRHPLEALVLISAGYLNAVAVMGDTVSEAQVQVLLTEYQAGAKVTLFWPFHVDIVPPLDALFPEFFIRLRRYQEQSDTPAGFTAEEVRELIA